MLGFPLFYKTINLKEKKMQMKISTKYTIILYPLLITKEKQGDILYELPLSEDRRS